MPETLYEAVVEVEERVVLLQESCRLQLDTPIVTGNTGEKVRQRWESGERGERGGDSTCSCIWRKECL